MSKGVLGHIIGVYDKHYKILLIIPIIIFLLSAGVVFSHYQKTGEFVAKGVSLKGGTTILLSQPADVSLLTNSLLSTFPNADLNVRSLNKAGKQSGVIVEASDIDAQELIAAIEMQTGPLNKADYTIDTTGSSLGESFFKQAIISVLAAFALMAFVVFLYFRDPLPSFYAVFSVFADMLFALAVFNVFDMRLTTAGVAAFLMLIGYSIDTDILLTSRVLKKKEGTVSERMASTIPTGMTMTLAAMVSVIIAYYATEVESLKQIMFILGWGLVADVIFTWLFNAAVLRILMERKERKHGV